jgi:hypothetical protein
VNEIRLDELRKYCGGLVTRHLESNRQKWRWAYEDGTEASPLFTSQNAALRWAEDWCGNVEMRPIGEPSKDEGCLVRPGYWRKTYGTQKHKRSGYFVDHWVYQPKFLTPEEPRPVEEIQARLDARSLAELETQLNSAFQQILARAFIVEEVHQLVGLPIPDAEKPLWRLILIVRGMVDSLNRLVERRPGLVNPIAERQPAWPVSLSLNPQHIKHVMDGLRGLGVGTKAPTPTRPGQRVDPNRYFTQLASRTFGVCRFNAHLIPELVHHCQNTKAVTGQLEFWKTTYKSTTYVLSDKSWIAIPQLEILAGLSEPVTHENFTDWWTAIKLYVLAYWSKFPDEYSEALEQIGKANKEKEYTRRKDALNAVKQAFRSLVGLGA